MLRKKLMKLKRYYKNIFNTLLLLLWCYVIFYFSSEPLNISASRGLGIIKIIKNFIAYEHLLIIGILIRKTAHFSEYFILALLTYNLIRNFKLKYKIHIILLFCLLYAISDEIHQYFIPGRVMSHIDVLIDFLGSLVAVYLISKFDNSLTI